MSTQGNVFRGLLAIAAALFGLCHSAWAQEYALVWRTIDGGGGFSSQAQPGAVVLRGTIGQPDAGVSRSGDLVLTGGFWAATLADPVCPADRGDANCDGVVNLFDIDPLVIALFDPAAYGQLYCGGAFCSVDVDCSGNVNFFDVDPFLTCVFETCGPCP